MTTPTSAVKRPPLLIGSLIVIALILTGYALRSHFQSDHAHSHAHGHDHAHAHDHDHGAATLTLNNGQRWKTDEPLRLGMQRLRDAVALQLDDEHENKHLPSTAQAKALADAVRKEVTYLMQNCQLAPEADANLHVIINDLMAGASLLTAGGQPAEGIATLIHALQTYPVYFDHPHWHPLPKTKS